MCAWVDNVCECTVRSCVCHMFHKTHESYFFRAMFSACAQVNVDKVHASKHVCYHM